MTYPGWRWDGTQWQPVPTRKKRTGWVVAIALIVPAVVILLCIGAAVLVFSSDSDSENGPTADGQQNGGAEATSTTGRDGQFEFTVLEVERDVPPPDEFFSDEAQGEYVKITMRVENIGNTSREIDSDEQYLYDADGDRYRAVWDIGEWQYETVNPGNSLEVAIHYDVPPRADLTQMELHDSPWSYGVEVGLPD